MFDNIAKDESWSGMAFTRATFINALEVEPFLYKLGFEKITLLGQEGLKEPSLTKIESANEIVRDKYLEIYLKVCDNPQYFAYSNHLLYIGKIKV